MSEIASRPDDAAFAAKKFLDAIWAEYGPVMAEVMNGDYVCWVNGYEIKFRMVSVKEACGYCGGPGVVGRGPDDYYDCPVCRAKNPQP